MARFAAIFFLMTGLWIAHNYNLWPAFAMWFCLTFAENLARHSP
jgi:hypothetical protein